MYVERFRGNQISQKATFILRTFFTEGGEFCLTREDFPPQFDPVHEFGIILSLLPS